MREDTAVIQEFCEEHYTSDFAQQGADVAADFLEAQTKEDGAVGTVLELVVERRDGTTILRAAGEIDMASAPRLREHLSLLSGSVFVNLCAVSFLDSTGIAVLIDAHNRLRDDGGDLRLHEPQGIVRTAIEVVGLAYWIDD